MEDKNYSRDTERAGLVSITARITGYEKDTVRKVIRDERKNEIIMTTFMTLQETLAETENELKKAVRNLIPFN